MTDHSRAHDAPTTISMHASMPSFATVLAAPVNADIEGEVAPVAVPVIEALELAPVGVGSFVPCVIMAPLPPGYSPPASPTNKSGTAVWFEQ